MEANSDIDHYYINDNKKNSVIHNKNYSEINNESYKEIFKNLYG